MRVKDQDGVLVMKTYICFAIAAGLAAISAWFLVWGSAMASPVAVDCGLGSFIFTESPKCGWPRTAHYGSKGAFAFALLFVLIGLVHKRTHD